jgi:transposase-like protein
VGKKYPTDIKLEAIEIYRATGNFSEVARRLGVRPQTARTWVLKGPLGVMMDRQGPRRRPLPDKETQQAVVQDYKRGMRGTALAAKYDMTYPSVRRILEANGVMIKKGRTSKGGFRGALGASTKILR